MLVDLESWKGLVSKDLIEENKYKLKKIKKKILSNNHSYTFLRKDNNDEIFNFSLSEGTHIGLFLALIGTFCASTGNMVHQRNLNNNFPPIQTIAYAMLYGSLVTFLVTQVRGAELLFENSVSYISSLLYLSIFGSIFAFVSYLKLLEKVGPGRAGYVGVVMPVLALMISTIFEKLEWQIDLIIGLPILIVGAILVINQKIKTN